MPRLTRDPATLPTPTRVVRTGLLVAVPVALVVLLAIHPAGNGEALLGVGGRYYWLHIVLLFGFPAAGVVLAVLVAGQTTWEAWVARGAAFVYACAYGAYDALAGITIGAYTMRADEAATREEALAILDMRGPLSATGIIGRMREIGSWSWLLATIATAAALHRAGVRWWVTLPLIVSGWYLVSSDHVPPLGWASAVALAIGVLLVELVPRRTLPTEG